MYWLFKNLSLELEEINGKKLVRCSRALLEEYKDKIIAAQIPLWHKKSDGKLIIIPLEKFDIYVARRTLDFYLEENWVLRLDHERLLEKEREIKGAKPSPKKKSLKEIISYVEGLGIDEQIVYLQKTVAVFNDLKQSKDVPKFKAIRQAAGQFGRVVLINNIVLNKKNTGIALNWPPDVLSRFLSLHKSFQLNEQKLYYNGFFQRHNFINNYATTTFLDEEQKKDVLRLGQLAGKLLAEKLKIIKENIRIIDSLLDLFEKNQISYRDVVLLNEKITGSTAMDHSIRTTFLFILFANFFNEYLNNSGANKIRVDFNKRYKRYYQSLFVGREVSLQYVFKKGLRPLDKDVIKNCTLGVSLHDISKYADLDYHDSNAPFDFKKVNQHALKGYLLLANLLNEIESNNIYYNPEELGLIIAQHHDYYDSSKKQGHASAGIILHQKYNQNEPREKVKYFMSYEASDFFKKEHESALVFLPAKMLEIIDIFDALTDRHKKRGPNLPLEDALKLMKKEFLEEQRKIDPILFNMFVFFIDEKYRKLTDLDSYLYSFF